MTKTHWKKLYNPDYLGAYSLYTDDGRKIEPIYTIKSVAKETVPNPEGKKGECIIMHFIEEPKPMVVNATNAKIITKLYKTPYIEEWIGCKIQLYATEVKAFGDVVDALRIKPIVPKITQTAEIPHCADCSGKIEAFGDRNAAYMAEYTHKKYGKPLCAGCAQRRADLEKADKIDDPLAAKGDEPVDLDNI